MISFFAIVLATMESPYAVATNPYQINDECYRMYRLGSTAPRPNIQHAYADSMMQKARRYGDVKAECLAIQLKGYAYFNENNLEQLISVRDKQMQFAEKTEYKQYMFGVWNYLITYYSNKGESGKVINELKQYNSEALRVKNTYGVTTSYRKLGREYIAMGNYDMGINLLKKALEYNNENNGNRGENVHIYGSIAEALFSQEKYDSSVVYAKAAVASTATGDSKYFNYYRLARAYGMLRDSANCMAYSDSAIMELPAADGIQKDITGRIYGCLEIYTEGGQRVSAAAHVLHCV